MRTDDTARATLGIEVLEAGDGQATVSMLVRTDMTNGHGVAHGGMVFTLADTAFGVASNSGDDRVVTASAHITYIAPSFVGQRLTARATKRLEYGRSALYDVTVTNTDGEIVAEYRGTARAMKSV